MLRAVAVTIDSIMKPVFGTPTGTGVLPTGGIATQTPTAKISGKAGLRWCLSTRMKPRGLVSPSMPRTAATPRKAGSSIAKTLGSSWARATLPSSAISETRIRSGSTLSTRALRDPLDVVLAQLALEQALGIADAVEAEMADVGLRGDEGHRHPVAHLGVAQRLVEDEGELVGRAEAGGALHRADHHRAWVGDQGVDGGLGFERVIDLADRLGVGLGPQTFDFVEGELGAGGDDQIVVVERAAVVRARCGAPPGAAASRPAGRGAMSPLPEDAGVRSTSTALRSRQPTATQGFDGTKMKLLPLVTTETWCCGPSLSRSS